MAVCEYCHGDREGYSVYLPRKGIGRAFIPEGKSCLYIHGPSGTRFEVPIEFCPKCGRKLKEGAN